MSDAPLILAIENSNPSSDHAPDAGPGVAIGRPDSKADIHVLDFELLRPVTRHDDDLMGAIDRLTRRTGVEPRQIGRVAVSVGPGGYTALRIAIATAKMIAEATGARTIGVPTAAVAALGVSESTAAKGFAVVLASKGEVAFVTVFRPGVPTEPGFLARASDLASLARAGNPIRALVADQFIPDTFRRVVHDTGMDLLPLRLHPAACLRASLSHSETDPSALVPMYAREPEAVKLWRERHG